MFKTNDVCHCCQKRRLTDVNGARLCVEWCDKPDGEMTLDNPTFFRGLNA